MVQAIRFEKIGGPEVLTWQQGGWTTDERRQARAGSASAQAHRRRVQLS